MNKFLLILITMAVTLTASANTTAVDSNAAVDSTTIKKAINDSIYQTLYPILLDLIEYTEITETYVNNRYVDYDNPTDVNNQNYLVSYLHSFDIHEMDLTERLANYNNHIALTDEIGQELLNEIEEVYAGLEDLWNRFYILAIADTVNYDNLTSQIVECQEQIQTLYSNIPDSERDYYAELLDSINYEEANLEALLKEIEQSFNEGTLSTNRNEKYDNYVTAISVIAARIDELPNKMREITSMLNTAKYNELMAYTEMFEQVINELYVGIPDYDREYYAEIESEIRQVFESVILLKNEIQQSYEAGTLSANNNQNYLEYQGRINMIMDMLTLIHTQIDEITGISNVTISDNKEAVIYSIKGERLAAPERGKINIFKYKDGSIKKVMVK